ncbi:MAG: hypothetical protein PHP98_11765, partial [Kiritimatiellae bacterium]|nr:hypothetical protein [Kiritimatiellia bacterium]
MHKKLITLIIVVLLVTGSGTIYATNQPVREAVNDILPLSGTEAPEGETEGEEEEIEFPEPDPEPPPEEEP